MKNTVGIKTGMEKLYTIITRCLHMENKENGLLEDVETIVNSYYNEKHLEEPVIWITQQPSTSNRQADISQTMDLVVPFEFDCGVYEVDLDDGYVASQNLTNRVILSILNNWKYVQAEELPHRRLIKNISLNTYSPVGYVQIEGKSDKMMVTGVVLDVLVTINWEMCIREKNKRLAKLNEELNEGD